MRMRQMKSVAQSMLLKLLWFVVYPLKLRSSLRIDLDSSFHQSWLHNVAVIRLCDLWIQSFQ